MRCVVACSLKKKVSIVASAHAYLCAAERLVDEMRCGVRPDTHPSTLSSQQLTRVHELLHVVKFADPRVCGGSRREGEKDGESE